MSSEQSAYHLSPETLRLWFVRLLGHKESELSPTEVEASHTLKTVCLILNPKDPPSAAGYYATIMASSNATWLAQNLKHFDRVAHVEITTSVTGEVIQRLWLLSDWQGELAQRKARDDYYKQRTREWLEVRARSWRVFKRMIQMGFSSRKITDILCVFQAATYQKFGQAMDVLNVLGWNTPETVSDEEIDRLAKEFVAKPGHIYTRPWDFTTEQPTSYHLQLIENDKRETTAT